MCDNTFSILKDFRLILSSGIKSEQMFIEDPGDVDMYFSILITELEEGETNVKYETPDREHGIISIELKKGLQIETSSPMCVGTYTGSNSNDEKASLYIDFRIKPIIDNGKLVYNAFVQFKIKGGE